MKKGSNKGKSRKERQGEESKVIIKERNQDMKVKNN